MGSFLDFPVLAPRAAPWQGPAMTFDDPRGVPLTAADGAAAAAFEAALQDYLHYSGDPLAAAEQALAADPAMAMGHVLRAWLLLLSTEGRHLPAARQAHAAARALAAEATEGERRHIAAVGLWCAGQRENAARVLEAHLVQQPRDILALAVGHYLRFFAGQVEEQRDIVARALPGWDETVPGYGLVLGLHAFGLNETAQYAEAEAAGRRAVARDPGDNYAIHAVAHVLEAQSRTDEGLAWLEAHETVWRSGNFAVHLGWHRTLLQLEAGDVAGCLDTYDTVLRRIDSDWAVDINDATALLWRLDLAGHDSGNRWADLADAWERVLDGRTYVFNDMHAVMAFVAARRTGPLAELNNRVGEALRAETDNARTIRRVGMEVIAALELFGREDWREAARRLFAVRGRAWELGCSRLQQGVLHLTTIEAALRAGDGDMALAVASERLALDPGRRSLLALRERAARLRGDRPASHHGGPITDRVA